ncbi:MAG TPA: GNAT family N-acetyltransferase [Candidatus Dormibacteraeota bacterium]|nr:GNAT family N-acetyltransferase [Candidatus Dormibacteraeota bacterium]
MGTEGNLVSARLARGCRCFGAWSGGVLAGYGWLSSGPEWIGELDLEIRPGAGEAYIWNCATLPDHRRKGVFRDIVAGLAALGRAERLSRLWIGTVALPAEKVVPEAGFAPVLHFSTEVLSGVRWLKVVAEERVEPGLLAAGREVLAVGGRPLRLDTFMKRAEPKRH